MTDMNLQTEVKGKETKVKGKEIKKYAENLNKFYSNNTFFNISEKDLIMEFGLRTPDVQEEKILIENVAIMSLEQARRFSKVLAGLIILFDKKRKDKEKK